MGDERERKENKKRQEVKTERNGIRERPQKVRLLNRERPHSQWRNCISASQYHSFTHHKAAQQLNGGRLNRVGSKSGVTPHAHGRLTAEGGEHGRLWLGWFGTCAAIGAGIKRFACVLSPVSPHSTPDF